MNCPAIDCTRRCGALTRPGLVELPWWVCTCEPCDCGECRVRAHRARTAKTPLPGARGRPVQLAFADRWRAAA